MVNAPLDENGRQGMIGLLNTNGTTITRVQAKPSNHALKVSDGTTGSDNGGKVAALDENSRFALFVSSSGGTKVPLYVTSDGKLLIKST